MMHYPLAGCRLNFLKERLVGAMAYGFLSEDQVSSLARFSVGTLDERDAMMVLEVVSLEDDTNEVLQLPMAMTPLMARDLGAALLVAAEALEIGVCVSHSRN